MALLPLLFPARQGGSRGRAHAGAVRVRLLSYFFLLGVAFIAVEISFMQKFVLFLGHPTHAMSVILFSLLLFAGFGSRVSERFGRRPTLILLSALLLVYAWALPSLLSRLMGLPFNGRVAVTVLLVSAPGALMGTAFPLGIRITHRTLPRFIPWAWAMNGASSVVGAIAAVFVALYTGFSLVIALAAALYALAALALPGIKRPDSIESHE